MAVKEIVYPIGTDLSANGTSFNVEGVAAQEAFTKALDACVAAAAGDDPQADEDTNHFTVVLGRAHTHTQLLQPHRPILHTLQHGLEYFIYVTATRKGCF